MAYRAPSHPLEVLQQLNYEEAVEDTDPRFVDLDAGRGSGGFLQQLAIKFYLDLDRDLFFPPQSRHVLLFGPIGCGKSTELRRFAHALRNNRRFLPVLLNVRGEVDINNMQYADMLMALTTALTRALQREAIDLPPEALEPLRVWFTEQVQTKEDTRELAAELHTEAKMQGGIPFFAELFAKLTTKFKNTSSYKTALREVVQKSFSQFASAFNTLIAEAEKALKSKGLADRLLLIVDGTDKIPLSDAERLFVIDSEQLLAIEACVLYTAPISLKYAGADHGKLDSAILPIVKLYQRDGSRHEAGWAALRELLVRRINAATFTSPADMEPLIDASGGHPRELLRLLRTACELTRSNKIDAEVVGRAIDKVAADFRYWLQPEDYKLLAEIDHAGGAHVGNDERTCNLLWRLALLHYNDGTWRRSHPAVRRLEGYALAQQAIATAAAAAPGAG